MTGKEHPCKAGLTPACFEKYPNYAKKVFAYKLLQAVIGSPLSADLQKMLWRHLVQIPISWMEYDDFIIPDDIPLEEIISEDWTPDEDLADELTIDLNELIPDDYEDGDELPDGVTIEEGTEIPDDWSVGDDIPDGITIDISELFSDVWTASDPLPEGIVINIAAVLPEVWTVGEDLPFGITVDPDYTIDTDMLATLGIYVEEGTTYEEVFGDGWDPTTELPGGSSWKPYEEDAKIIESAVPPLYLPVFEAGPVHSVDSAPDAAVVTEATFFATNDSMIYAGKPTWAEARNATVGSYIESDNATETEAVLTCVWAAGAQVNRYFLAFDLSTIPAGTTILTVHLKIKAWGSDVCQVSVQEGSQNIPATIGDYDAYETGLFAAQLWQTDWNTFELNAAGINYAQSIIGGNATLCLREYEHDYPGIEAYNFTLKFCACLGSWSGNAADRPNLVITYEE